MRSRALVLLIPLFLAPAACAARDGSDTERSRSNVITEVQLAEYEGQSLLVVIQALRPSWLRQRGSGSMRLAEDVQVYVNGVQRGTAVDLEYLNPGDVREVEYLSSRDATFRFGTGHVNGAILVMTK